MTDAILGRFTVLFGSPCSPIASRGILVRDMSAPSTSVWAVWESKVLP